MSKSSGVNTSMNVYAVVCVKTNEVLAKYMHHNGKLVLNGLKLGIADYNLDNHEREILMVTSVYLSSNAGNISKMKNLDIDSFVTSNSYGYEGIDLLFLSRDPKETISLCTNKQ